MRKAVHYLGLLTIIIMMLGSLVITSCVCAPPTPLTPEKINHIIDQMGYKWTAGKTSVSDLTLEEKKRLCGVKPQKINVAPEPVARTIATTAPASFDWRNYSGKDWTTPIKDQGGCGSCVAFGTLGAFESILEILDGSPDVNPNLSEEYLFFCGGADCSGWYPSSAANFLQGTGVPDEDCWPYVPQNAPCTMCTDPYQDCEPGVAGSCYCANAQDGAHHGGRAIETDSWTYLTSGAEQIKNSIVNNGPVIATMVVYDDFFSYTGGCYKHVSGGAAGGHCITIVGYDDNMDCGSSGGCGCSCNGGSHGAWIVKNSWGTNWGESGWFKIAYGECQIENNPIQLVKEATDLYIRDDANDTGNIPTSGEFWLSPELIVKNADEGAVPTNWSSQPVIRGEDNWIYVKAHNIGANTAHELEVHVYKSNYPGTEFIYPWDYGDEISTSPVTINALAPGDDAVAKFKWPAGEIPSAAQMSHPCLLAEVRTAQDIDAGQWGICTHFSGTHVWENNNLAQRNLTFISAVRGESIEFPFDVGSIHSAPTEYSVLVVDRSQIPENVKIELSFRDVNVIPLVGARLNGEIVEISAKNSEIKIPLSQERVRVYLTFKVPEVVPFREYTVNIVQKDDKGQIIGGITLVVKVICPTGC